VTLPVAFIALKQTKKVPGLINLGTFTYFLSEALLIVMDEEEEMRY